MSRKIYPDDVAYRLRSLWDSDLESDLTIAIRDPEDRKSRKILRAHKIILAISSEYFYQRLRTWTLLQEGTPIEDLSDASFGSRQIEACLKSAYGYDVVRDRGRVCWDLSDLIGLACCADFLGMPSLRKEAIDTFTDHMAEGPLSIENVGNIVHVIDMLYCSAIDRVSVRREVLQILKDEKVFQKVPDLKAVLRANPGLAAELAEIYIKDEESDLTESSADEEPTVIELHGPG